ncbi:hypothetical protein ACCD10_17240 [Pseudomonas sp. Pseusp122]|uniref:hypothetical protein n=1 Tax=unclassified Pseudomonas TaxID=196821 RepID=UPI0039A4FE0C
MSRLITLLAFSLALGTAAAAPAYYYRWQGDNRIVCAQSSPGPGWTRLHGAFVKSDCSV